MRSLILFVAPQLVALKADNPARSVPSVIRAAIEDGIDHPLTASTVHRLLSREGLFDKKPPDGADRRRFAFRDAGELWMSDVMHGPSVRYPSAPITARSSVLRNPCGAAPPLVSTSLPRAIERRGSAVRGSYSRILVTVWVRRRLEVVA